MTWIVKIFTIFPEMFPGPLRYSLAGKAKENSIWDYKTINIRDYANDKHNKVDDTPSGGGAGLVMRADVLGRAIDDNIDNNTKIIYMSPKGKPLTQDKLYELTRCDNLAIICGRFEGIDERIIEEYKAEEISIGDYILSGGEIAAIVLLDGCIRLLDGTIGNKSTLQEESFGKNANYSGLLEYPLYTRPLNWKNRKIPDVLYSGDHKRIDQWRLEQAKEITKNRRLDLWTKHSLSKRQEND
jgi:tRNA (guanine37-N1)-methyltransferase